MGTKVSIIMYHYVRDLKHSRYPEIKGLRIEHFREQLEYIRKYYVIIRMEDLIEAVNDNKADKLPDNSLLLTFDDGYKDHYEFVFPVLDELGIQGSFFPPAKAIQEHQILDVNKIHFVLASVEDKKRLIKDIYSMLDEFRKDYSLDENEDYFNRLTKDGDRFDTKEVVFIKRLLQKELSEELRNIIVKRLFNIHVSKDEGAFSRELYMNIDQLKCMRRHGMYIGSHGYDHYWLNTLPRDKQEEDIDLSLKFLKEIGCDLSNWAMSYPYGAYNDTLISLLEDKGCCLALTTEVGIADLGRDNFFTLPRLDTNDLPKDKNAEPNHWTLAILKNIGKAAR